MATMLSAIIVAVVAVFGLSGTATAAPHHRSDVPIFTTKTCEAKHGRAIGDICYRPLLFIPEDVSEAICKDKKGKVLAMPSLPGVKFCVNGSFPLKWGPGAE
ncbi:hypothetical protein [Amycolatopsis sp. NPDC059021]|uniref:hypothetical protein n=1 Tax=Amycolatopsis sp. NPDC059021 TaxID=3346704 RepID=UPI00366EA419